MEHDDSPGGELTYRIIGLAMRVHRRLGPGLLESVYEKCLCYELTRAEMPFQRQVPVPVHYDDVTLDTG
jgi:GxxExxY protein